MSRVNFNPLRNENVFLDEKEREEKEKEIKRILIFVSFGAIFNIDISDLTIRLTRDDNHMRCINIHESQCLTRKNVTT